LRTGSWNPLDNDILSLVASGLILGGYHLFLLSRLRRDRAYTIQAVNALARTAWVENVMRSGDKDILAVQTLRNAIMGPTFLASTAVLLIVGTLTLSGQGDKLGESWQALNLFGARHAGLWQAKVLCLVLDFMAAFFSFAMAIRLFIHVGFMINVPMAPGREPISPRQVALHLHRAGAFHSIGMRAYYLSVPLVLWLFGPHLMLLGSAVLVPVLFQLDRAPVPPAGDGRP